MIPVSPAKIIHGRSDNTGVTNKDMYFTAAAKVPGSAVVIAEGRQLKIHQADSMAKPLKNYYVEHVKVDKS
jgi:hypothetical protein